MSDRVITFITGNSRKLDEVMSILGDDFPCKIVSKHLDLIEIQGSAEDVAIAKCKEASEKLHGPVIVEDTSLYFNAMNNLPGPYIKWFLKEIRPIGLYKMLLGFEDKSARIVCTIAYHDGTSDFSTISLFQGCIDGHIVEPKNVPDCFGFDDCFQPNGYQKTFSEIPVVDKNRISHRFKAVSNFREHFIHNFENENSKNFQPF